MRFPTHTDYEFGLGCSQKLFPEFYSEVEGGFSVGKGLEVRGAERDEISRQHVAACDTKLFKEPPNLRLKRRLAFRIVRPRFNLVGAPAFGRKLSMIGFVAVAAGIYAKKGDIRPLRGSPRRGQQPPAQAILAPNVFLFNRISDAVRIHS